MGSGLLRTGVDALTCVHPRKGRVVLPQFPPLQWALGHWHYEQTLYSRRPLTRDWSFCLSYMKGDDAKINTALKANTLKSSTISMRWLLKCPPPRQQARLGFCIWHSNKQYCGALEFFFFSILAPSRLRGVGAQYTCPFKACLPYVHTWEVQHVAYWDRVEWML